MTYYVGTARRGRFQTYKDTYVAGVLTRVLFDAPVTKLSLRNATAGTEEVLTYSGTATYDAQLTRTGVGTFEWWFVFEAIGKWSVNPEWTETISGQTVSVKGNPKSVTIETDPFTWSDVPVVP